MIVALIASGALSASKTYAARRWTWVRNRDPRALSDGTLTITCRKSARPGTKAEDDSYAVSEHPAPVPGVRVFHLLNLTDATQADVYQTTLGPRGHLCTCPAGARKLLCKHVETVAAVVAAGGFDREDAPELCDAA